MTCYEKIDHCDNKLKLSKCPVKSIYFNFSKIIVFLGGFQKPLLSNYPRLKFRLIWGKASVEKRILVMAVYHSNRTQLHLEDAGRRFYGDAPS